MGGTSQPAGNFSSTSQELGPEISQGPSGEFYNEGDTTKGFYEQTAYTSTPLVSLQGPHQMNPQGRMDPLNMAHMGSALPDMPYQTYGHVPLQRYSGSSPPTLVYPTQNVAQFPIPNMLSTNQATGVYSVSFTPHYQTHYGSSNTQVPQGGQSSMNGNTHVYQAQSVVGPHQQMGSPYYIQQGQYGPHTHMYGGNASPAQYGFRGNYILDNRSPVQASARNSGRTSSIAPSSAQSSVVRGPPRKPRQNGHAIWIGNLPPQTELMNLVCHVCKEAPGVESLFLISKSNCAFANYKDEASCAAAQTKIHDSRFQTVKLVSRLRRSSVGTTPAGTPIPTGPAALLPLTTPTPPVARSPSLDNTAKDQPISIETNEIRSPEDPKVPKDKFFIVKSLTVEDLELSVRNELWATQSHNEEALSKAFQTANNVYLIFSANKSGEYFGYAKMVSDINDDPAAAIEFAPSVHTVEDPELPKAIPTPETEFVPKGRIIDDSARGTIFWEVESDDNDGLDEEDEAGSNKSDQDPDSATPSKAWGKPFKIEWISTTRLPFYRTRGLRNPWNSNREVKIARDGTELETSVGHRLTGLFHRTPSPIEPNMQNLPVGLMGGYPPMHPY